MVKTIRQTTAASEIRERLLGRIAELEKANAAYQAGRRAALNLMEDAILAKQQVDELNRKLEQEIAERKRAEADLRESESRLRLVQSAGGIGGFDYDLNADSAVCSPEYYSMFGLPENSPVNSQTWPQVIHPNDRAWLLNLFMNAVKDHEAVSYEFRLVRPDDGKVRWISGRAAPIFDDSGQPWRLVGGNVDITDRKQMEMDLQEAHADLEVRVQERTQELARANEALSREIEERKALEQMRMELVHRVVTTQEEERRRISRDLHDQMGQRLTALRLKLSALRGLARSGENIEPHVAQLQEIAGTVDAEISFLAAQLRPTALDDLGLEQALKAYVSEWSSHYDIPAELHSNLGPGRRPQGLVETHLYRIAQEALNNVIKHADASHVSVMLENNPEGTVLVVEDDGKGFDPDTARTDNSYGGLRLLGIRERASLIGGDLEIETSPDTGTAIYVRVPHAPAS